LAGLAACRPKIWEVCEVFFDTTVINVRKCDKEKKYSVDALEVSYFHTLFPHMF